MSTIANVFLAWPASLSAKICDLPAQEQEGVQLKASMYRPSSLSLPCLLLQHAAGLCYMGPFMGQVIKR